MKKKILIILIIIIIVIAIACIILANIRSKKQAEQQYGLIGNTFFCRNTSQSTKCSGESDFYGIKRYKEGHFTLITGGWSYFDETNIRVETFDDVYLCFDDESWNSGEWYDVYSAKGDFMGSSYSEKRRPRLYRIGVKYESS